MRYFVSLTRVGYYTDMEAHTATTVKPVLSGHSKKLKTKIGFEDKLSLNVLQGEHSVILSTFIKLLLPLKSLFCLFCSGRLRQVLILMDI